MGQDVCPPDGLPPERRVPHVFGRETCEPSVGPLSTGPDEVVGSVGSDPLAPRVQDCAQNWTNRPLVHGLWNFRTTCAEKEWMRLGYLHVNHHLRQFGA